MCLQLVFPSTWIILSLLSLPKPAVGVVCTDLQLEGPSLCPVKQLPLTLGVSNPCAVDWSSFQIIGSIRLEMKGTINVMCLNHPETIPRPPVRGKMVSHEIDPWCQKGWGLLP